MCRSSHLPQFRIATIGDGTHMAHPDTRSSVAPMAGRSTRLTLEGRGLGRFRDSIEAAPRAGFAGFERISGDPTRMGGLPIYGASRAGFGGTRRTTKPSDLVERHSATSGRLAVTAYGSADVVEEASIVVGDQPIAAHGAIPRQMEQLVAVARENRFAIAQPALW